MIAALLAAATTSFNSCEKEVEEVKNEAIEEPTQYRSGEEYPEDVTFSADVSDEELYEILEPFEPYIEPEVTFLEIIPDPETEMFTAGITPIDGGNAPSAERVLATSQHFRAVLAMWKLYVYGEHDPCGGYYFTHGANGWSLHDGC